MHFYPPRRPLSVPVSSPFQSPSNLSASLQFYMKLTVLQVQHHLTKAPINHHTSQKTSFIQTMKRKMPQMDYLSLNGSTCGWKAVAIPATWVPWGELSVTILKIFPLSYTLATNVQASNLLNTPYFCSILQGWFQQS